MKGAVLFLVATIILCAPRVEASPVEVRIVSGGVVLEHGKNAVIRCVLRNTSPRDLVVPVGPSHYYQIYATDARGVRLPWYPAAISELAPPAANDFVVLQRGTELRFALSIKVERPKKAEFEDFGTRQGVAVISDHTTRYLCPKHFYLSVRAYGPDQANTRSVRRKIGERFWDGDLLSDRVSARIK